MKKLLSTVLMLFPLLAGAADPGVRLEKGK